MIKEAIILAGGMGTRLRDTVPDLPKCMAPVAGKPFLFYVIRHLQAQGIARCIFSLGYKHEAIEDFLQKDFASLQYDRVVETEPLGTGGAIKKACSVAKENTTIVLNGDTFYKFDLEHANAFHSAHPSECTLLLKPMQNFSRYGQVEIDSNDCILSFHEKKFCKEGLINAGAYLLNVNSFLKMNIPEKFSFENDFLEKFVDERKFYGCKQDCYFIDIGIPEDYEKAQTELPLNFEEHTRN